MNTAMRGNFGRQFEQIKDETTKKKSSKKSKYNKNNKIRGEWTTEFNEIFET